MKKTCDFCFKETDDCKTIYTRCKIVFRDETVGNYDHVPIIGIPCFSVCSTCRWEMVVRFLKSLY